MDNVLFYRPLWEEEALMEDSSKHLEKIRLEIMTNLMHTMPVDVKPPTVAAMITASINLIKTLLRDSPDDNVVLQKILDYATESGVDPNLVVRGAIVLWYKSASPIFSREPDLGLPAHAMSEGGLAMPWVQKLVESQYFIGNLGYLSMLLTAETWEEPYHPKLKISTLLTNATIAFLFATYVITPHLKSHSLWQQHLTDSSSRGRKEMSAFLKTTWHVSREGWEKSDQPPGAVFSALDTEVKISDDGRKLLTRVGCPNWHEAPFWHPFRVVPGSPWNKFIKNRRQKYFQILPTVGNRVRYLVPGSAVTLTSSSETYYGILRSQFDRTNTPRTRLSDEERELQFWRLAGGTGLRYPTVRPTEQVKKPAADLSGNLTLPFLTTTARALRYEEEPEFVDEDFYAMAFHH
ncbi:hypothetical protein G7Z17_g7126 [Cylindrodendrum hubeiense]|uniref:Uncharacterized protein n=1 Tax=Cylindrodendrum hubeiense TaxID=595255 RepID=A0A9P5HDT2_9HYPO|nr:hypothetical protein G7Z17_g7126 [Cylindrodendrum hubeiense]